MTDHAGIPGWGEAPFEKCVKVVPERKPSVPTSEYLRSGEFPVVDQGVGLVAGYTNDETRVYRDDLPMVVFGDHTRAIKYVDFPFATGADGTKLLRAKEDLLDPRFLYFSLLALDIPSRGYNRHFTFLRQASIPVPEEKREQRAIAGVLARIERAAELEGRRIAVLKELKAATMTKVFREGLRGEPLKQTAIGEIPQSWDVVELGSILDRINYGTSVHCTLDPIGAPVLRIPNVIGEQLDNAELKYAMLPADEVRRLTLVPGDILFVRTNGNRTYTGRCAVYEGSPTGALFASYLIRVRLKPSTIAPDLVRLFLSSTGHQQITGRAHPAADGKYNIDTGVLKGLLVPGPDPTEQDQIVGLLSSLKRREASAQHRLEILCELFSSSLNQLMTGQIRVTPLLQEEESTHA